MVEAIDLPAFAAAVGRAIHDTGIPVTPERSVRFARALSVAPPSSARRLYWTARAVFVSAYEQLEIFDKVFAALFESFIDPADSRGDPTGPPMEGGVRRSAETGSAPRGVELRGNDTDADATDRELAVAAASAHERLAERDFAELDPDELRALHELMRELALAPPPRVARRRRRAHHGERLDVRATLRASCRTGGDPARQLRRHRVERPRRL